MSGLFVNTPKWFFWGVSNLIFNVYNFYLKRQYIPYNVLKYYMGVKIWLLVKL